MKTSTNQPLTEKEDRAARLTALADQVFGTSEEAHLWLSAPEERLESRTPLSMLTTEEGGQAVEALLWQIDEGVYT